MVRYPALFARHIFIFGPGTMAKDRPDKFGIRPMLGPMLGQSLHGLEWPVTNLVWTVPVLKWAVTTLKRTLANLEWVETTFK